MMRLPPASEHDDQAALFRLVDTYARQYPALLNVAAIPNGGHRHIAVAARLKQEGVKRGVPDVMVWVARGGWHGLALELKVPGNAPSPDQRAWHARLTAQGYLVQVHYSWVGAWRALCHYLDLPDTLWRDMA